MTTNDFIKLLLQDHGVGINARTIISYKDEVNYTYIRVKGSKNHYRLHRETKSVSKLQLGEEEDVWVELKPRIIL